MGSRTSGTFADLVEAVGIETDSLESKACAVDALQLPTLANRNKRSKDAIKGFVHRIGPESRQNPSWIELQGLGVAARTGTYGVSTRTSVNFRKS